ncbi:MAG: tRNA pseudouridine(13) synthase TruD [Endozoicomonas sp. (ex Botrylloides leachii)]|nr:tRNA pseudouridine(13) synthase TruD [Endozoicomonas sp. (ex Botrylloides leachii)]
MSDFSCDWNYAWGGPVGSSDFKSCPEDFRVDEELPFEPVGEGEHVYVLVEKISENTDWVAGLLAKYLGIKQAQVSYAGRKDRQGVAKQWFCLCLPGQPDPNWDKFKSNTIKIIKQTRHLRKLRRGVLKYNYFEITLRSIAADHNQLEQRLSLIATKGVPNYFGSQRFGRSNYNLQKAKAFFEGNIKISRNKRSIYLSAARSWIFNNVLSSRVGEGLWSSCLVGDIFGFHTHNSLIFDEHSDELIQRVMAGELSPTGPLWGSGCLKSGDQCRLREEMECDRYSLFCDGLEKAGIKQERRVLRLFPENMTWTWASDDTITLKFRLQKGCFATAVLRELVTYNET